MKAQKNPEEHSEKIIFITAQIIAIIIANTICFFLIRYLNNLFGLGFNTPTLIGVAIFATAVCLFAIAIPNYRNRFPKDNEDIQEQ